jgi:hypothetical protein
MRLCRDFGIDLPCSAFLPKWITAEPPGPGDGAANGTRSVLGVVVVMVVTVMVVSLVSERRRSKHHQQQSGSENLLHGKNLA